MANIKIFISLLLFYQIGLCFGQVNSTSISAGFGSSLKLTPTSRSIGDKAISAQLKSGQSLGSYLGNVSATNNLSNQGEISNIRNVANSNISDIIVNTTYIYNSNIDYKAYQTAAPLTNTSQCIDVFKFDIRDGGDLANDTDFLATELNTIVFNVTNSSNIRSAALFAGNAVVNGSGVISGGTISFSGLGGPSVTALDDSSASLTLRVTFMNTVSDNQQMEFSIASATANPLYSLFGVNNAGGATSSSVGDRNRIEVTADRLAFLQQPTNSSQYAVMGTVPSVKASDIFGNADFDYNNPVILTSTGIMSGSPLTAVPLIGTGISLFNGIVHTSAGTYTLAATSGLLISTVSGSFVISAFVISIGDFQPLIDTDLSADGSWRYYGASGWLTVASGGWDGKAPQNTITPIGRVLIDKIVTGGGSTTKNYNCDFIIQSGGEFILLEDDAPPIAGKLLAVGKKIEVLSGGTLNVQGDIDVATTSTIIVRSGGTMKLDQFSINNVHPMWNGIELFEGGSIVIIKDWDWSASPGNRSLLNTSSSISSNVNGYKFGNLYIDANLGDSFTLIGGGVGVVNLCENDLNITNASAYFIHGATNKTGVNGFVVNGNMTISDGNFSFGTSFTNDSFNHKFTINGKFVCASNDNLKIHHNDGITVPTTLNGSVTFKGDVKIHPSVNSFTNDGGSASPPRMFVNFEGGAGISPKIIDIAPTAVAIAMNIKANSYRKLATQNLIINSVPSYLASFTVESDASLHFGWAADDITPLVIKKATTSPAGTNSFFSSLRSTLYITSPDGISATSGIIGNVQTTTAPTYNSVATYWYQGRTNQVTGTGLPTAASAKIVFVDLLSNSLTLTPTLSVGISSTTTLDPLGGKLEILKGTVIGSNTADFFGTGRLKMSDGEYQISSFDPVSPATFQLPQLLNYATYDLSGGTIHLNANNQIQILKGIPTYYNLKFSGSNTLGSNYKGVSSATAVSNSILIAENAIVDVKSNSFGMLPYVPTFTMSDNSRFITAGTSVKPDITGSYNFGLNTTIEFTNNSVLTMQRLRLTNPIPAYANIVVSGSNVGNISPGGGANSNLSFQPNGSFRVTSTGTYKLFNSFGFSGSANTAISNSNDPSIYLDPLSTIEYAGANQNITSFPTPYYANLTISGSGQKELDNPLSVFINENLNLNSSLLLVKPSEVITVRQSVLATSGVMQIENKGQLLQISDAALNSGSAITYNGIAQARNLDYIYWSSPVDNFATLSLPGNNHYQWNTLFPNANMTQGNWESPSAIMEIGRGYIARASNGADLPQALDVMFSGKPNNGQINIPVFHGIYDGVAFDAEPANPSNLWTTKDDDNWNLLGNPYPSAIDAEKFLEENISVLQGAVYIWTHLHLPDSTTDPYYSDFTYNYDGTDYTIYNKLGSSIPNTFNGKIAAAQGFMVNMLDSKPSGSFAIFNNAMRYDTGYVPYNNSDFFRNQDPINQGDKSRIWLDLVNTTTSEVGSILLGYAPDATMGKDHFYDCSFESRGDHSFYSLIDGESFVIQGRALPFDIDDIIPLGFTLNHIGDLAISIKDLDGLFGGDIPVFLEDKDLNIFHDLKNAPYFFNSEVGVFNNRFQLRYGTELSLVDFDAGNQSVQIYGSNGFIYLRSSNAPIQEVVVYDLIGRLLLKFDGVDKLNVEIPFEILSKQTIIVKAKLKNGHIISQKIIF